MQKASDETGQSLKPSNGSTLDKARSEHWVTDSAEEKETKGRRKRKTESKRKRKRKPRSMESIKRGS
jgi:hypothetical protein